MKSKFKNFDNNVLYEFLKHSDPRVVVKLCQTNVKYAKLCQDKNIFRRLQVL